MQAERTPSSPRVSYRSVQSAGRTEQDDSANAFLKWGISCSSSCFVVQGCLSQNIFCSFDRKIVNSWCLLFAIMIVALLVDMLLNLIFITQSVLSIRQYT